jgi:hypothetical protein
LHVGHVEQQFNRRVACHTSTTEATTQVLGCFKFGDKLV